MVGFAITSFEGVEPKTDPLLLRGNQAQTALNCRLWNGHLRPWRDTQFIVTPTKAGTKLTIYRIGESLTNEAQYWLHWLTDVDAARGPIHGDASERTYYTGDGVPKVTNLALAIGGGTNYPQTSYSLGAPKPVNTPNVALGGGGSGTAVTRNYVYTYVSGFGEEGQPSTASANISAMPGQSVTVSNMSVAPAGGYNITQKRIYRLVTGDTGEVYLLAGEIAVGTTSFADNLADSALSTVLPSFIPGEVGSAWDVPPADMHSIIALPAFMAGLSKTDVCLSETFQPHAWPIRYQNALDYTAVGQAAIDQDILVLTTGNPYLGTGSDPGAVRFNKVTDKQACVSKRSIVDMGRGIAYASPDGLMYFGPGRFEVATRKVMDRDDWQALKPESIHGTLWEGRYLGFYDNGITQGGFLFDPNDARSELTFIGVYATAGYNDPLRDGLYLQIGTEIRRWDATGLLTFTWRSKKIRFDRPRNMGVAQVTADGPVTFKWYADDVLRHTQTVTSKEPFRLPAGYTAESGYVELSGTNTIRPPVLVAETIADLKQS